MDRFIGIDYGSKLAGTTCITYLFDGRLKTISSIKNSDADQFILSFVQEFKPTLIGLDAPLSLPEAFQKGSGDYFYRKCDRILNAMSPMFLGGLTARAMALKANYNLPMIEVYPAALVKKLGLIEYYNKKSKKWDDFINNISPILPFPTYKEMNSWHEVDSILAWLSTYRYLHDLHETIGEESEGFIVL